MYCMSFTMMYCMSFPTPVEGELCSCGGTMVSWPAGTVGAAMLPLPRPPPQRPRTTPRECSLRTVRPLHCCTAMPSGAPGAPRGRGCVRTMQPHRAGAALMISFTPHWLHQASICIHGLRHALRWPANTPASPGPETRHCGWDAATSAGVTQLRLVGVLCDSGQFCEVMSSLSVPVELWWILPSTLLIVCPRLVARFRTLVCTTPGHTVSSSVLKHQRHAAFLTTTHAGDRCHCG